MNRRAVTILGVPVDAVTRKEAVALILGMLEGGRHHVMTPNSEMLTEACRSKRFKEVLLSASLNLPDGAGLLYAAKLKGQKLPQRVTGVDTVIDLCSALPARHQVFLLGAGEGVAERAARELKRVNPILQIAGTYAGSPGEKDVPEIIRRIREAEPHLLLVAFGAPAQDLWIADHLIELPSVRVAMGVGGTFDFIAGVQKRAPKFMRAAGLEWLFRLIKEPKRWRRIVNAVVVFPWMVISDKMNNEKLKMNNG